MNLNLKKTIKMKSFKPTFFFVVVYWIIHEKYVRYKIMYNLIKKRIKYALNYVSEMLFSIHILFQFYFKCINEFFDKFRDN